MFTKTEIALLAIIVLVVPFVIHQVRLDALRDAQSADFCSKLNGVGCVCNTRPID